MYADGIVVFLNLFCTSFVLDDVTWDPSSLVIGRSWKDMISIICSLCTGACMSPASSFGSSGTLSHFPAPSRGGWGSYNE